MSEYYCTNCGADLGDQEGFEPDCSYWTCKCCGTLLTDPNDPDFDNPSGVTWFCDGCGACLNKQIGFSDIFDYWTCSECGYENRLSEDDIYESEEAYQRSLDDEEPKYGNTRLDKINRFLDRLNDRLDEMNESYSDDDNEDQEDQEDEDYDDEDYDDEDDEAYESEDEDIDPFANYTPYINPASTYENADENLKATKEQVKQFKEGKWIRFKRKIKHFFITLFVIAILIVVAFVGYKYWEYTKRIPVGYTDEMLRSQKYKDVVDELKQSGFTNIEVQADCDLEASETDKLETVKYINIKGTTDFEEESKFPYDTRIIVYYHDFRMVEIPVSSDDCSDYEYEELVNILKEAGFVNVKAQGKEDLITGWITKENSVDSITINGEDSFYSGEEYPINSEIIILYHSF